MRLLLTAEPQPWTLSRVPRHGSCQLRGNLGPHLVLLPEVTFLDFHSHETKCCLSLKHRPGLKPVSALGAD